MAYTDVPELNSGYKACNQNITQLMFLNYAPMLQSTFGDIHSLQDDVRRHITNRENATGRICLFISLFVFYKLKCMPVA